MPTYQVLDEPLYLGLGLLHGLLRADDGDQLLVLVVVTREDDPRSRVLTHLGAQIIYYLIES